jgi:hypothetical protein
LYGRVDEILVGILYVEVEGRGCQMHRDERMSSNPDSSVTKVTTEDYQCEGLRRLL